jgi:hypothetical protein
MRGAYEGSVGRVGFEWDNLRAASGTVEHVVGQAPHLRVPTLAGVLAESVRQGDCLLQDSQDVALDVALARVVLGQVGPSGVELAAPACRADDEVLPGRHA